MTPRFRSIAASFALAVLVAGGLVGPALHQAMHGMEHADEAAEAAAQTDHVHVDGIGFTVSLDGNALHAPCLLCVSPHAAPPVLPALVSDSTASIRAQARPIGPTTAVLALLPIRGPPAVA